MRYTTTLIAKFFASNLRLINISIADNYLAFVAPVILQTASCRRNTQGRRNYLSKPIEEEASSRSLFGL